MNISLANTSQVRCFKLLNSRSLDARDFDTRFPVSVNSFIVSDVPTFVSASSQNSNVWRPNIHVWTHFEPIFSLRVHGWIQTTVSQLAGVRGCRRKRQLSFLYNVFMYWCTEDLN